MSVNLAIGLAQFAPQILKWITGSEKAEEAAKTVVGIAEQMTGQQGQHAIDTLKSNPDKLLEFRKAILDREAELDKAFLQDRQDARARDVAIQSTRYNFRADLLAILAVCALIACVWMVAKDPSLPSGAREAIMFVAGVFAGCVRDVYGFEFGSSRGSKEKDEIMSQMGKK